MPSAGAARASSTPDPAAELSSALCGAVRLPRIAGSSSGAASASSSARSSAASSAACARVGVSD